MIKVQRTAKPSVLTKTQMTWIQALLDANTQAERRRAEGKYRHPDIRQALSEMFHGKCAYCESKIAHVSYGNIEHFKPKSRPEFVQLAFEWSNLMLSCPVCNGAQFKGTCFPSSEEGGPFIDPTEEDPNDHLDFVIDINARLATVVGKTTRGRTTEKTIGLNRPDLRAYRSKLVMQLRILSNFAGTDPEAKSLIEAACQDNSEYAAFARQVVSQMAD